MTNLIEQIKLIADQNICIELDACVLPASLGCSKCILGGVKEVKEEVLNLTKKIELLNLLEDD